jgi:membrane protein
MRGWVCRPGVAQRRGSMAQIAANRSGCLGVEMASAATTGSTHLLQGLSLDQFGPTAAPPRLATSILIVAAASTVAALTRDPPARPAADEPFGHSQSRGEPLSTQMARARQNGRGRRAASPFGIPWKGWKDIFCRTVNQASEDRLLAIAAGLVFFGLLALFPAITALVSCYGLIAKADTIRDNLSFVASVVPAEAYSIVQDQVARVVSKGGGKLGFGFAFGLGMALWSANAGMKALIDALNVVYEEEEKRGFVRLNLVSLGFTVGVIAAMLVAVGAVVVTPLVLTHLGLNAMTETIVRFARWPALMLGMLLGLAVLYRHGPSRREAKWEWLSIGAVLATSAWFGGSALLSWYFANFANYDATYGSLGAAIGTMVWMWMSATVILLGGELNAEIEHQTARDTTVGAEKPLGARGATMADTVGAAQAA